MRHLSFEGTRAYERRVEQLSWVLQIANRLHRRGVPMDLFWGMVISWYVDRLYVIRYYLTSYGQRYYRMFAYANVRAPRSLPGHYRARLPPPANEPHYARMCMRLRHVIVSWLPLDISRMIAQYTCPDLADMVNVCPYPTHWACGACCNISHLYARIAILCSDDRFATQ